MARQHLRPFVSAYSEKGKSAALSADSNKQLALAKAGVYNRSGGAANAGAMVKLLSTSIKLYTKVADVYTLISAATLAAGVEVVNTTNDDGFLVGAPKKFGLVGVTVSNTATGGTYVFEYWNGSGWATLTTLEAFSNFNSAADAYVAFLPPVDWAAGSDVDVDSSLYYIRITHSTAPADAGNINALWVASWLAFRAQLANNTGFEVDYEDANPLVLDAGEALMAYFSTANAANHVEALYAMV